MPDDARFAAWWQQVGYPQMAAHLPRFILRQVAGDAERGAKAAWDAALTWNKNAGQQPKETRSK